MVRISLHLKEEDYVEENNNTCVAKKMSGTEMMSAIIYSKDKCTSINVRYIVFFVVFFPNNCYNMYNVNVIAGYVLCNIHMRSLLESWLFKKVL